MKLNRDLAGALLVRLKASFPEDYENFLKWTGTSSNRIFLFGDGNVNIQEAEKLIGLLVEYKPLTKRQLEAQTPEQLRDWEQIGEDPEAIRTSQDARRCIPLLAGVDRDHPGCRPPHPAASHQSPRQLLLTSRRKRHRRGISLHRRPKMRYTATGYIRLIITLLPKGSGSEIRVGSRTCRKRVLADFPR